ncbi:hypothetical protein ACFOLF_25815 [Paenibacillus sepulcri]|uniref:Prolipoprotein diacylglyceryl transferase n=1 Tax=Paenibacillus sepulcri TaxID=359917 RepID=A0ABS7C3Q2_9BACL|nr:hypothetical protein [Paenibacillus sepulcri]
MPELVSIGSARLDGLLLTFILSAAAGLGALWLWQRRSPDSPDRVLQDLLFNAVVIALLGWKLAFIIRDPESVWNSPQSLLLVRGSDTDALIGLFLALLYLLLAVRVRKLSWLRLLDTAAMAVLPGSAVWNGLTDFPYRIIYALLFLIVYIYLLRSVQASEPVSGEYGRAGLLGAGIGGLVVSLFAPYPPGDFPDLTAGLSALQWCFILLAAGGALLQVKRG